MFISNALRPLYFMLKPAKNGEKYIKTDKILNNKIDGEIEQGRERWTKQDFKNIRRLHINIR